MTKENVQENKHVQFDTTSSRYDLAIKEVEERVKLGWSVKASFMLGGGYLRVDYVRADPNRYKDVGKTNDSKVEVEPVLSGARNTEAVAEEVVESVAPVESVAEVKETPVKTARKTTAKKTEVKDA